MHEIIQKIKTQIKILRLDNERGSGFVNAEIEKRNNDFIRDLKEIYKLVYEKRDKINLRQKHIDKEIADYKQRIVYQVSEICRVKKYWKKKVEKLENEIEEIKTKKAKEKKQC